MGRRNVSNAHGPANRRSKRRRRPASDDTARVLTAIRSLQRAIREQNAPVERAHGITLADLHILRALARRPGLSVRELAQEAVASRANVSLLLRGLKKRGLVWQMTSATNRRVMRLYLTREGAALGQSAAKTARARFARALQRMPPTARSQLSTLLEDWLRSAQIDVAAPQRTTPGSSVSGTRDPTNDQPGAAST